FDRNHVSKKLLLDLAKNQQTLSRAALQRTVLQMLIELKNAYLEAEKASTPAARAQAQDHLLQAKASWAALGLPLHLVSDASIREGGLEKAVQALDRSTGVTQSATGAKAAELNILQAQRRILLDHNPNLTFAAPLGLGVMSIAQAALTNGVTLFNLFG